MENNEGKGERERWRGKGERGEGEVEVEVERMPRSSCREKGNRRDLDEEGGECSSKIKLIDDVREREWRDRETVTRFIYCDWWRLCFIPLSSSSVFITVLVDWRSTAVSRYNV